jgi:hypothetical protein
MSANNTEKTQAERITECMTILKKLTNDVGIDAQNPSIRVLKKRMAQYWRDGKLYEDKLPLWGYDRSIIYRFPRWAHQEVEVTLRVNKIRNPAIPADLEEELAAPEPTPHQPLPSGPAVEAQSGTSSETQSGPSHPSPQE